MTALTKITSKSSCQHCGAALRFATSGRRKQFCSDACRQAAFRNEKAARCPSKGDQNRALQPFERQYGFLSRNKESAPPRSSARSSKGLAFEKQNSVTYKLTDGQQVNAGGGRASRALGYVMEVFPGRWMARVRNLGSDLLPFGAAKQEAIRLYRCRDRGTTDWIRKLNLRTAAEIDRVSLAKERRKAPVDLMGGGRPWPNPMLTDKAVIRNIIEVETCKPLREEDAQQDTLNGDDYPLDYYEDGYPELPACLDRRKPRVRQAA